VISNLLHKTKDSTIDQKIIYSLLDQATFVGQA